MLDERLAFLRTVAAIGGWAPLLEIDALRILPADAESFVPLRRQSRGSEAVLYAFEPIEHDDNDLRDFPISAGMPRPGPGTPASHQSRHRLLGQAAASN